MSQQIVERVVAADGDIVIRAGAGCGKTYTLVQKYLAELETKRDRAWVEVDRIAAITFTEKAAEEMTERIRARLSERIRELGSDHRELRAHLTVQRHKLSSAYISTIHSFCARLLKEKPVVAQIDPRFSIIADTASDLLSASARAVILENLQSGNSMVEELTIAYGFDRSGPGQGGLRQQVVRLSPLFRAAAQTPATIQKLGKEFISRLDEKAQDAARTLAQHVPQMRKQRKNTRIEKFGEWLAERPELLTKPVTDYETARELMENSAHLRPKPADREKEWAILATEVSGLLQIVAGGAMEREIQKRSRAFLDLVDETSRRYQAEKERLSVLDFDDLQEKTAELLEQNSSALTAYQNQFLRILVDEFQDTDGRQNRLIQSLAPPGSGRLLIVGDHRQSIYRFRGADVSLFDNITATIEKDSPSFPLIQNRRSTPRLLSFFNRFFPPLMGDGEETEMIPHRPPSEHTHIERYVTVTETTARKAEHDRRREAHALALKIDTMADSWKIDAGGKLRPLVYGDIALLFGSLKNAPFYQAALTLADIPFSIVKGSGFYQCAEVRDMISLLTWLDNRNDTLALFSLLRSPFAGLTDDTLLRLSYDSDGAARNATHFLAPDAPLPTDLPPDENEKLLLFRARMSRLRSLRNRIPIAELLERAIADFGYGAVMTARRSGERKLANTQKLIERARQYEQNGAIGLKNFLAHLIRNRDQKAQEPEAESGLDNAVQIMTVHQSKGLEFGAVIIADIGYTDPQITDSMLYHSHIGFGMKKYDVESGVRTAGPLFERIREEEKRAASEERKRLLYVAMTRARDHLILSGGAGSRRGGPWREWIDEAIERDSALGVERVVAPDQLPPLEKMAQKPVTKASPIKKPTPPTSLPAGGKKMRVTDLTRLAFCPRLFYHKQCVASPPKGKFIDDKQGAMNATGAGIAIHSFLETVIGQSAATVRDEVIATFTDRLSKKDLKTLTASLETTFAHPFLATLRLPEVTPHIEERLIMRLDDAENFLILTGAADLVWMAEETLHVVDYKFAKRPGNESIYQLQTALYTNAWMDILGARRGMTAICYLKEPQNPLTLRSGNRNEWFSRTKMMVGLAQKLPSREAPSDQWAMRTEPDGAPCDERHCPYYWLCFPAKK